MSVAVQQYPLTLDTKETKMSSNTIYHIHHIIPKHAGGTNDPSNLVRVTVEEHAEAHRKLYEKYGRIEDKLAWQGLAGMVSKQDLISKLMSHKSSGENNSMYGRSAITEQQLCWYTNGTETKYISEGTQPEGWYRGRANLTRTPHTLEHKNKISESLRGKIPCNRLKVISPSGQVFESIKSAADFNGMTVSTFRYRLVKNGDWSIQR